MTHSLSDRYAFAADGSVQVTTRETGPNQYILVATATFDRPVGEVWALLDDFEKLLATALPGGPGSFEWLNGGGPGQAPVRFQLSISGQRLLEEVYHRDPGNHSLRYRMLEPALGILEYDAVFELAPKSDGQTLYSVYREVTLEPGALDGILGLIQLETQNMKEHFARPRA